MNMENNVLTDEMNSMHIDLLDVSESLCECKMEGRSNRSGSGKVVYRLLVDFLFFPPLFEERRDWRGKACKTEGVAGKKNKQGRILNGNNSDITIKSTF